MIVGMISEMDKMEEETYNTSHTRIIFYDYMGTESVDVGNGAAKDHESIYRKSHDSSWRTADGRPIDAQGNVIDSGRVSSEVNNAGTYEGMGLEKVYGRLPGDQVENPLLQLSYRDRFEAVLLQYAQKKVFSNDSFYDSRAEGLTLQPMESVITENEFNSQVTDAKEGMDSLITEARALLDSEGVKRGVILQKRVELLTYAKVNGISDYSDELLVSDLEIAKNQLSQSADEMNGKRNQLDETKNLFNEAVRRGPGGVTSDELNSLHQKIEMLKEETKPLERLLKILDEYSIKIELVSSLQRIE